MKQVFFSANRKSNRSAIFVAVLVSLGIILSAFVAGALIGIDPAIAIRLIIVFSMPLVLAIVWSAPKSGEDPGRILNLMLASLLLTAVFWPPYIIFSVRSLPSIEPKRFVLLIMLVYWLYKMFTAPQLAERFFARWRHGGWPLFFFIAFLGWRLVTAFSSEIPVYSLIQLGWNLINYYLVFFVALSSVRGREDIFVILKLLVWCAVVVALVGFIERGVGHNLFANMVSVSTEGLQAAVEDKIRDGGNRVQATFEHPMMLAEYLVFTLPFLMLLLFRSVRGSARFLNLICVTIILGGIFLSGTRSAILTGAIILCLTLILYFFDNIRSRTLSAKTFVSTLGLVGVLVGALAAVPVMAELIQGRSVIERNSSGARLLQYQQGIPKVMKQPVFGYGVGIGNQSLGFKASHGRFSVDSYYLTLLMDSGIPGALFFILSLFGFVIAGAKISLSESSEDARLLARVLSVSLLGLLVTKSVLSIENNLVFLSLVCALIIVLKSQSDIKRALLK